MVLLGRKTNVAFLFIILLSNFEPGGPKKRGCAIIRLLHRVLSLEIARDYHPLFEADLLADSFVSRVSRSPESKHWLLGEKFSLNWRVNEIFNILVRKSGQTRETNF